MKFERLSKESNGNKKFLYGFITCAILLIIFNFFMSYAKYKSVDSVKLASGTINYESADLNVIALYEQRNKGDTSESNYESILDVPIGNYEINKDNSYCIVIGNTAKLKDIPMKYEEGRIYIGINKKGTKCYVYLDIQNGISTTDLLVDIPKEYQNRGTPDFNKTSCSIGCDDTVIGLFTAEDDFGTSSYFRGSVDYNWVKFGKANDKDIWWRIIRFNGNGTIRLIYAGTGDSAPAETGNETQIGTSAFNSSYKDQRYVKYVYENTDSTIKKAVDKWYTEVSNLNEIMQSQHIDTETGFCNDSDIQSSGSTIYFKTYERLVNNKTPSFKCNTPEINLYTKDGTKGNNKLTYPVGLITADEVSYAGEIYGSSPPLKEHYLYTGRYYWTMSPSSFNTDIINIAEPTRAFINSGMGDIYTGGSIRSQYGIRPVINLKANTTFKTIRESYKGTSTNPYVVID